MLSAVISLKAFVQDTFVHRCICITHSTFLRKEQPSVSRARPPVGWQSMTLQLPQSTTVCAWLYTVVICKQPGHFTSMKKLFGVWIMRFNLCLVFSSLASGFNKSRSMAVGVVSLAVNKSV